MIRIALSDLWRLIKGRETYRHAIRRRLSA